MADTHVLLSYDLNDNYDDFRTAMLKLKWSYGDMPWSTCWIRYAGVVDADEALGLARQHMEAAAQEVRTKHGNRNFKVERYAATVFDVPPGKIIAR